MIIFKITSRDTEILYLLSKSMANLMKLNMFNTRIVCQQVSNSVSN